MTDIKLGQLADDNQQRDAIHVAIYPVVAAERLKPGEHVGIVPGGAANDCSEHIGIVDPFLKEAVEKGQRFNLLLYQNTVTGMRHHWSHPAFENAEADAAKAESEAWLRRFCKEADCPDYDTVIRVATGEVLPSVDDEYYGNHSIDNECMFFHGLDAHGAIPHEFWVHVERVTGKKCQYRPAYFSCSC